MKRTVIACMANSHPWNDSHSVENLDRRIPSKHRNTSLMKTRTLALLLAPLATLHAAEPPAAPSGPPPDRKWKLVWSDEFDGKTLDTTRWFVKQPEPWIWPGIKTSPQPANLDIDGQGHCVVQLTRDPDGTVRHPGSIVSKFEKAYGYFETRAQFSRQPGWWSAVWLAGFPYECGADTFTSPQEFDIFEDFYKPKKKNDIQHCYHCSVKLAQLPGDQGNATGIGEGAILRSAKLSRTSAARKVVMDDYSGWHTVGFRWTPLEHVFYVDGRETLRQDYRDVPVTNVPQRLYISACLRTPKSADDKPFYGRLEEAQLPDKLVVDYVRVYEEDTEPLKAPEVTLKTDKPGPFRVGEPVTFHVKATAPGRKVSSVMLFSMGRLRAEKTVETATSAIEATFAVTNLFPGVLNTVIAMAKDDAGLVGQSVPLRTDVLTGKEYTGTPWQGTPQKIPGTVRGGCYDEGGNGVAFRSAVVGPSDVRLEHRKTELGDLPEAVGVGGDRATWITYEVDVATSGEYDAELFMNRPDYATKHLDPATPVWDERIRVNLSASGPAGAPLAEWTLPATWHSGAGWRNPQKSLGKQKVRLPAGRHKLVMCFDGTRAGHTYFCKLVFAPASAQQATPEAASSGLTPDRK